MDFKGNWDRFLPFAEFAYNNSYHVIIQMAPMKHCMEGGVNHQYAGMSYPKESFMGQIWLIKPLHRFGLFVRGCLQRS